MPERILFLTGHLARESLERELAALPKRTFDYQVHDLGLKVAALMTAAMIARRLDDARGADRVLVPGLCGGDLAPLRDKFGVSVERGPKDLKDLPEFFGMRGRKPDLSQHRVKIFAEIVDAPHIGVAQIVSRAQQYVAAGADVIDLGCLPGTPFAHLEEAVQALTDAGMTASVDSLEPDELRRAGLAGASYLLSLKQSTLHLVDEVESTPVLIPEQAGDLSSLYRAAEFMQARGREYYLDPILDPVHFGFTDSILRYRSVREVLPEAPIMMGIGNVTELTDADTSGITAILMGVISELRIDAVLSTQVSGHASSAVREADLARRIMYLAHSEGRLPRAYHPGLMVHHDKKPFPYTKAEIGETAASIRDRNFRIQVSEEGVHVYNRDGIQCASDPFDLFEGLDVDSDGGHAFYLGVELARAQIAWQLGKRYLQDNELEWGVARRFPPDELQVDERGYRTPGSTLASRKARRQADEEDQE